MTIAELEKRLKRVEQEIAELKSDKELSPNHPFHVLESIHGTFEDDASFREATRLGRKWRQSQDTSAPHTRKRRK